MQATFRQASEKQVGFILSLGGQKEISEVQVEFLKAVGNGSKVLSAEQASRVIEGLLAAANKAGSVLEMKQGDCFKVGSDIFKVSIGRESKKPYAKKLVGSADQGFSWEMAPGAVRSFKEADRLTKEDAAAFGRATGTCACCGRLLTDSNSIAIGIGPICLAKF